jgi:hypothetical protein
MKSVLVSLCCGVLGFALAGPSMAQESGPSRGLTRAEVKAELADYRAVGYEFSEMGYPELAVEAAHKVAALRAARAAAAAGQPQPVMVSKQ